LPTIDEAGVKGFHLSWWQELVAPSGVPPAVVARLARAVREVAEDPKVRKQTEDLGLAIEYRPPSAYAAQVKEDMAVFHRVAAEAHLSVD
jgi:tripartite-type tricarboxylate transporter receptor subunit TctC